ncbi:MAG: hypothetical protein JST27_02740 [Bacteroidetes bacterium]|nr:hypothetical protein [Bacteroidota bacterium]
MEYNKISIKVTTFVITALIGCSFIKALAQANLKPTTFTDQLKDIYLEPFKFSIDSSYAFIIFNKKSCLHCGKDLCRIFETTSDLKNYNVFSVFCDEYNISGMLPNRARILAEVPCSKTVLFRFKTNLDTNSIIFTEPSPQLVLMHNGLIKFLSYGETLHFISTKTK